MQRSRACLQSCGGADGFVSIQDRTLGDRDDSRGRFRKSAVDHTNLWCVVMGSLESRFALRLQGDTDIAMHTALPKKELPLLTK